MTHFYAGAIYNGSSASYSSGKLRTDGTAGYENRIEAATWEDALAFFKAWLEAHPNPLADDPPHTYTLTWRDENNARQHRAIPA